MKSESDFREALDKSQYCVLTVASWMKNGGCDVMVAPTIAAPDYESRWQYTDGGDIEIRQRVEVKQRALSFTNAEDYPYATVIVDEKYKIDKTHSRQLWGYIICNREVTHACIVRPDSKDKWSTETMWDSKYRADREFYVCPKEHCLWCKIGE